MAGIDWIIIAVYLLAAIIVGICFTRKASRSTDDFFVAGRTLPWFVAGTSIVATTFSSDTPLVVAGISRQSGIAGHWFWLSAAMGQIATVFFFAKFWRRTRALSDVEFVALRYERSTGTSVLRVFKVFFDGILLNCIVMASVILAMAKVIVVILDLPETALELPILGQVSWSHLIIFLLGYTAVCYAGLSGLYGVVYTDLLQFGLAMAGSIGLAVILYIQAGNDGLVTDFARKTGTSESFLNFFPGFGSSNIAIFTMYSDFWPRKAKKIRFWHFYGSTSVNMSSDHGPGY